VILNVVKILVFNVLTFLCNIGQQIDNMQFRAVFWVVLPCPEDSSEHHTRRRENLKSHTDNMQHLREG
jgi:hypothetical protein